MAIFLDFLILGYVSAYVFLGLRDEVSHQLPLGVTLLPELGESFLHLLELVDSLSKLPVNSAFSLVLDLGGLVLFGSDLFLCGWRGYLLFDELGDAFPALLGLLLVVLADGLGQDFVLLGEWF